ncbi:MAG TPA: hypothetical protein VNX21_04105 [Candidatus Thermoplasmatota archaeon]|nr:hypothetical protein [Candidatus Thermoplasmatota archaeon]
MDWFRPALSAILLLTATLAMFFFAPQWPQVVAVLDAVGPAGVWAFTLLRVAALLALGYVLSRASVTAPPTQVALLVAGPAVVVGTLVGVYASLRPLHVLVTLALAAALAAACVLGARQGERR